jgi:uroporphyrinogen III methyltransferase/synthase
MPDVSPLVYLVGAGPGDPGLLTLRAVECLAQADFVIYDKLVPSRFLDYASPGAERLCVADVPGSHPERGPQIHEAMIAAARRGKRVVRLKGGDPFLFARGGEEAQALGQAGIPFEVVPGVTAALGAAACAGIPLTHRLHASAVALVTGHEDPFKPGGNLDWAELARFPGTLVIYMGMARLQQIVQVLLERGKASATPSVVVEQCTTGQQRTVESTLAELPQAVRDAGLRSPAIIVIGSVVSLRQELAWFEKRPLFGKCVLVTRPRAQSARMVQRLEGLGASTLVLPTLEVGEPADWAPVDQALATLASYQWLVFTSVNGVHSLVRRLRHLGYDLRAFGAVRLAAIGPATAQALREYFLEPDLVPEEFRSETLAEALREQVRGQRVLLARADRGRDVLREELARVAIVDQIAVYSQVDAPAANADILNYLRSGKVDYVSVTSSNVARVLIGLFDRETQQRIEQGSIQLISISPVTSAVIHELGLPVAAEAEEYTTEGVVQAMMRLAAQQ